eukprot:Clim_evm86s25 gene=Clim_evmTU86s25
MTDQVQDPAESQPKTVQEAKVGDKRPASALNEGNNEIINGDTNETEGEVDEEHKEFVEFLKGKRVPEWLIRCLEFSGFDTLEDLKHAYIAPAGERHLPTVVTGDAGSDAVGRPLFTQGMAGLIGLISSATSQAMSFGMHQDALGQIEEFVAAHYSQSPDADRDMLPEGSPLAVYLETHQGRRRPSSGAASGPPPFIIGVGYRLRLLRAIAELRGETPEYRLGGPVPPPMGGPPPPPFGAPPQHYGGPPPPLPPPGQPTSAPQSQGYAVDTTPAVSAAPTTVTPAVKASQQSTPATTVTAREPSKTILTGDGGIGFPTKEGNVQSAFKGKTIAQVLMSPLTRMEQGPEALFSAEERQKFKEKVGGENVEPKDVKKWVHKVMRGYCRTEGIVLDPETDYFVKKLTSGPGGISCRRCRAQFSLEREKLYVPDAFALHLRYCVAIQCRDLNDEEGAQCAREIVRYNIKQWQLANKDYMHLSEGKNFTIMAYIDRSTKKDMPRTRIRCADCRSAFYCPVNDGLSPASYFNHLASCVPIRRQFPLRRTKAPFEEDGSTPKKARVAEMDDASGVDGGLLKLARERIGVWKKDFGGASGKLTEGINYKLGGEPDDPKSLRLTCLDCKKTFTMNQGNDFSPFQYFEHALTCEKSVDDVKSGSEVRIGAGGIIRLKAYNNTDYPTHQIDENDPPVPLKREHSYDEVIKMRDALGEPPIVSQDGQLELDWFEYISDMVDDYCKDIKPERPVKNLDFRIYIFPEGAMQRLNARAICRRCQVKVNSRRICDFNPDPFRAHFEECVKNTPRPKSIYTCLSHDELFPNGVRTPSKPVVTEAAANETKAEAKQKVEDPVPKEVPKKEQTDSMDTDQKDPVTTEENGEAAAGDDKDEVYCCCGHNVDSWEAVECDKCKRWSHLACYGFVNDGSVPGDFQCIFCYDGESESAMKDRLIQLKKTFDTEDPQGISALRRLGLKTMEDEGEIRDDSFAESMQIDKRRGRKMLQYFEKAGIIKKGGGLASYRLDWTTEQINAAIVDVNRMTEAL